MLTAALDRLLAALPEHPERAAGIVPGPRGWDLLLEHAGRHGVEGILCHELHRAGALPDHVQRDALQRHALERIALSRLRSALDEASVALDRAGIAHASLKGPMLGERIYPTPWLRPSTDVDLMVEPGALPRAVSALEALGYRADRSPTGRYRLAHHHHVSLQRAGAPTVELHFRAFAGFGTELPSGELLSRAALHQSTTGKAMLVLAPEDELVYLCVHGASHLFARLGWLYDLKLFASRHGRLDWDAIGRRTRGFGVRRAVGFALELLHLRLGVELPIIDARARDRRWYLAESLRSAACARPRSSSVRNLAALGFGAVLCDRTRSTAWFAQHHLLRVTRRRAQRWFPRLTPTEWSA